MIQPSASARLALAERIRFLVKMSIQEQIPVLVDIEHTFVI